MNARPWHDWTEGAAAQIVKVVTARTFSSFEIADIIYRSFQAEAARVAQGQAPTSAASAPSARQVGGDHYRSKPIQPWDAMRAWMGREQFKGFLRGSAIKYLARCDDKGGIEDLKKAQHYIEKLIELEAA